MQYCITVCITVKAVALIEQRWTCLLFICPLPVKEIVVGALKEWDLIGSFSILIKDQMYACPV